VNRLIVSALAVLCVIFGCRKNEVHIVGGRPVKCDIASQTNIRGAYLVGGGFAKTYYLNGWVKSVRTKSLEAFGGFDSLTFNFTYSGNVAKVTGSSLNYQFHQPGGMGEIFYTNDLPAVIYNFEVTFDPKTWNATKAGNTTFRYDNNGRLAGYDTFDILYDDAGNILEINGHDDFTVIYKYDYSRKAKQQFYYTTAFMTNDMFNLMEILGWIPVQPINLRTSHSLVSGKESGEPTFYGEFIFSDHIVDSDGLLASFQGDGNTVINTWACTPTFKSNATK
jgi:hypothetical protein